MQAFRVVGQRELVLSQFVEGDADLTIEENALQLRSGPLVTVNIDLTRPHRLLRRDWRSWWSGCFWLCGGRQAA